ncbi:MAG: MFS transporter [Pseudomonadota bacterium]
MSITSEAKHASRLDLFSYGLLGLPLAAGTLPVYLFVPTFYAEELGLGLAAVGAVLFWMRLLDVASDPVIGWLSDRTPGRFGPRVPWVAIGLPLTGLGIWLLFRPPEAAGLGYLALASAILYIGWTALAVPYAAWGAEVSPRYNERTRFAAWREGFVVVGTLVAAGIANSGAALAEGLGHLALATIIGLAIAGTLLLLRAPRPAYPKAAAAPPNSKSQGGWRAGITLLWENGPFRRLLFAWLLNGVANGLPATLFLLFVTHRLDAADQSSLFLLIYFGVSVAALPFWMWAARRWGKHRAWSGAMIWACLWFALAPFLGPDDLGWYAALCIGTGLALGADLALPPSMQADAVDAETARTMRARTALYFALWGMATKLSLALAVGIAFPLLDWAGGAEQGGWMLALLYGGVPIVFKLAAISLIAGHKLDETEHRKLRDQIEAGFAPSKMDSTSDQVTRRAQGTHRAQGDQ